MNRKITLIAALLTLLMLLIPAQAETATVERMPYGETAMDLIMDGVQLDMVVDGETYMLDHCDGRFDSAFPLYGGTCGTINEVEVPKERFSIDDDGSELLLGTVLFDVPFKAELAIYDGNRISGEYTLTSRIELTDVYTEDIYLPRDAAGKPVLVDRLYLLSYEFGDEIVRCAMPLYIGYDQFDARHAVTSAPTASPEPVRTVVFDDLHYGEAAMDMHMMEEENFIMFDGEKYSLDDDCGSFREAFPVYGGKTRAVHEITIPEKRFSVEDDGSELLLGSLVIDTPTRAQLTVCYGNRRSGEYLVGETYTPDDIYIEDVYLPRDAAGNPVVFDQIYFYSYEVSGETRRFAISLYIDYENYNARHLPLGGESAETVTAAPTEIPKTAAPTEAPVTEAPTKIPATPAPTEAPETAAPAVTEEAPPAVEDDSSGSSSAAPMLSVIAMALILVATSRSRRAKKDEEKKKAAAQAPASEPVSASDESLAKGQEILRQLQAEGLRISDEAVNTRIDKLHSVCTQMLAAVEEQPSKSSQLRRFLNYYLPTAQKMISVLRTVHERGVSAAEVNKVRTSTLHGLDLILDACQKQLDNLYKGEMLDASTDIEILEKMLARDGFLESEFDKMRKER